MTTPPPNRPPDDDLEALLRGSARLEEAPPHLIHRAEMLWNPVRATAAAKAPAGPWRRLLASLSFEGGGHGLALGLRGEPGTARQWLFTCDQHDIDLRAEAVDDGPPATWRLSGQVLGPEGGGEALLFADSAGPTTEAITEPAASSDLPLHRASVGELSEFSWPALPAGAYRLVLQLGGETQIELPIIQLGTGAATSASK